MPMVVPHQSQVGIATAGGGSSTPFRSVSSFLTPGAAEQAQGLRDLARGIDTAGNALEKVSLERQRMQTATDMLASKVETEESLRGFDSNYRQTHQGVSARDAEQAYGQFLQGEYDKLQKKYGGNPYHMEAASRMFEGIRQPALARAVAYRDNEEEGYKKTLLESSRAQTLQKFADPSMPWQEKEAALREEENNLRLFAGQTFDPKSGQWTGGKDVTAQSMALRQKMESEHLNGLVSSGQLDAARAFLGMGGASGGASTSANNLAANNFGNVKNGNGGYNAYASRQDGLMGVGERVLRYNNAPERGWHAQTLREFAGIYAPVGDGKNNPDEYAAFLGKRLGVDPNQKIDFKDPKVLAGLIQSIPIMEHGAQRVNVSEDEAMQAAQALLSGKKPSLAGSAGAARSSLFVAGDNPEGMTAKGNIDLASRPQVKMADGSTATVRSMSINVDGKEVLIPTVSDDGRVMSDNDAVAQYRKTGKHLGMFDTPEHATAYAKNLHEQQERMYAPSGGGPMGANLPASTRAQYALHIDALERRREIDARQAQEREQKKAADAMYHNLHAAVQGLPPQEQEAQAANYIASIQDQDMRKTMLSRLRDDVAVEQMRQKSTDYEAGRKYRERVQKEGLLPSQALAGVDDIQGMSDEGREKLRASLNKDAQKVTPKNAEALQNLLRKIDTDAATAQTDVDSYALEMGLTDKQAKQARDYLEKGGNKGGVTITRVERVYKSLSKGKKMPPDFFDLVLQTLEPGKPTTDKGLADTIANLHMDGESSGAWGFGHGRDETYADSLKEGRADTWLPDLKPGERQSIAALLRGAGVKVTDERMRQYKKEKIMGIGGR